MLRVKGMTCNHCRMAVEKALLKVPGVSNAEVDLGAGTARVVFDPDRADRGAMMRAVEEEGYTVSP